MKRISKILSRLISDIVITAFVLMFLLVFFNVVLRFLFSTGLTFSDEIARYAFVWCTFLGAVIAMQNNDHIGIVGIRAFVPERFHTYFEVFVNFVMLIVALVVLIGAVQFLIANLGTRAPFTGAPIAIGQASLVTGMIGLIIIFFCRIWIGIKREQE